MDIAIEQGSPATVVRISGKVDSLTSDALLQALSGEIGACRTRLVADFSEVEYMSSAGLRALLITLRETRGQGGDLRLAAVQPPVQRVLDLSGFNTILKVFGDVPAAVASYVAVGGGSGVGTGAAP